MSSWQKHSRLQVPRWRTFRLPTANLWSRQVFRMLYPVVLAALSQMVVGLRQQVLGDEKVVASLVQHDLHRNDWLSPTPVADPPLLKDSISLLLTYNHFLLAVETYSCTVSSKRVFCGHEQLNCFWTETGQDGLPGAQCTVPDLLIQNTKVIPGTWDHSETVNRPST